MTSSAGLLEGIAVDADASSVGKPSAAPTESFVVFRVGRVWYALSAFDVKEVIPRSNAVPIPQTPSFVLGVAHVSSRIVVVVDLRALLGVPAAEGPAGDIPMRDLVILADGQAMGARVDEVSGLVDVSKSEIQPLPDDPSSAAVAALNVGDRAVTVLDVSRLLALAESRMGGAG